MRREHRFSLSAIAIAALVAAPANSADLHYKDRLLGVLVQKVPGILKTFDPQSGAFGSGVWICRDQHPMYPLAVAYATKGQGNRYHKDPALLDVIVRAADPLIENMDAEGRWIFKKKDGSTWGMIWMPWTYSRWIRTFQLVRDDMPAEARKKWTAALTLGYTGISKRCLGSVHNIPTHHAMGLYCAGRVLGKPEWCQQAAAFLVKVAGKQSEGGYWSEGGGPVVAYDFVYVDALGTYFGMSRDQRVLDALSKTAVFHRHFTYPDGSNVETIDQRNPYHDTVAPGNVGFTFSPAGRAYLANQWSQIGMENLDADLIASLLLYGEEGPVEPAPETGKSQVFALAEDHVVRAATVRRGPWFVCLSAYTTPIVNSRWIQDRQNLVSIYHDRAGLILGGGNTKLQPAWSNFTVGDPALLAHKPGDQSPNFRPRGELYHVPSSAELVLQPDPGLDLTYGPETCRVRVHIEDDRALVYSIETSAKSNLPVAAHLTLVPHLGRPLKTGGGQEVKLGENSISLTPQQVGGSVSHAGYQLTVPETTSVHWPALPHNPYRKDGHADATEGRIEIRIPLDRERARHTIRLHIAS